MQNLINIIRRVSWSTVPAIGGLFLATACAHATDFETVSGLNAGDFLAPDLLNSDLHRVSEAITNDGYMNTYTVASEFGDFQAYGLTILNLRVREIRAMQELDKVQKSDLYADAMAQAIASPIKAAGLLVSNPVETVKGLPEGVGRMFRGYRRKAKSAKETAARVVNGGNEEEGPKGEVPDEQSQALKYAKKFMGVSSAQRKWAEKVGVDPYSSNLVLQEKLEAVAQVDAIASLGARLVVPDLGALGTVASASNLVWQIDPAELREQNLKRLQEQGSTPEQIDAFLDNSWYSPTLQTVIVASMVELGTVENLSIILDKALWAESEQTAVFFADAVRMLAHYQTAHGGLVGLTGDGPLVGGIRTDDSLVYTFPIDHLVWTEEIAEAAGGSLDQVASEATGSDHQVWLRGSATPRAIDELTHRGWSVRTNSGLL